MFFIRSFSGTRVAQEVLEVRVHDYTTRVVSRVQMGKPVPGAQVQEPKAEYTRGTCNTEPPRDVSEAQLWTRIPEGPREDVGHGQEGHVREADAKYTRGLCNTGPPKYVSEAKTQLPEVECN